MVTEVGSIAPSMSVSLEVTLITTGESSLVEATSSLAVGAQLNKVKITSLSSDDVHPATVILMLLYDPAGAAMEAEPEVTVTFVNNPPS